MVAPALPLPYSLTSVSKNDLPTQTAEGKARIETYTVMFDREGPIFSIIFGIDSNGYRFIANTPNDNDLLLDMTKSDYLNKAGIVTNKNGKNLFTPR